MGKKRYKGDRKKMREWREIKNRERKQKIINQKRKICDYCQDYKE